MSSLHRQLQTDEYTRGGVGNGVSGGLGLGDRAEFLYISNTSSFLRLIIQRCAFWCVSEMTCVLRFAGKSCVIPAEFPIWLVFGRWEWSFWTARDRGGSGVTPTLVQDEDGYYLEGVSPPNALMLFACKTFTFLGKSHKRATLLFLAVKSGGVRE